MRRHYPAILHGGDGESWGLSFVDLPVHAGGATMEAAVADLSRTREPIPAPPPVADIPAADFDAGAVVLVAVRVSGRPRPAGGKERCRA